MKNYQSKVALVVCDGVEILEIRKLTNYFENQEFQVMLVSAQEDIEFNTVDLGRSGPLMTADLNLEMASSMRFGAIVLVDGIHSTMIMKNNHHLLKWLSDTHLAGYPVMASGCANKILYQAGVLSKFVLTRENTSFEKFVSLACEIIRQAPAMAKERRVAYYLPLYRATI